MSEWIEYTGSDEQLTELLTTKSKFMVDTKWSVFHEPTLLNMPVNEDNLNWLAGLLRDTKVKKYLICKPHPYADLIKIWADTGCSVWFRFKGTKFEPGIETEEPDWFNDEFEFKLTPFED